MLLFRISFQDCEQASISPIHFHQLLNWACDCDWHKTWGYMSLNFVCQTKNTALVHHFSTYTLHNCSTLSTRRYLVASSSNHIKIFWLVTHASTRFAYFPLQSNLHFCKFLDCFSLLLRLPLHSASPKWRRLTKRRAYLNLNRILLSFSSPILNEPCLPVTDQTALKPKSYSRFCQFEVKKEIWFYIDINLSSNF